MRVANSFLVVGLGNPGRDYERTRHNVGFEVVDLLVNRHGGRLRSGRERALVDTVRIGEYKTTLAKPLIYMNNSGESVGPLVKHVGIDDPTNLIVVHDELDLPVGRVKVKVGGGLAGHNGLRSIKAHLHDDSFVRVRIGVGKPPAKGRGADHVLSRIPKGERDQLDEMVVVAADAVEMIIIDGVDSAMDRFNRLA